MMKFVLIILLPVALISCKKAIQKQEENLIVKAMTDGQWVITSFTDNGEDITTDFSPYKFQYFKNNTVEAIKNGTVENTGTWKGNIDNMSISANFSTVSTPLILLNGTWTITDNSWTYVKATMTDGNEIRVLRLDKQ
jgi:hypothetical protein